ncbi:MAG: heme biosynthesis protein HemY [Bradyrhizobiaceae bacterium]|nr:heme biosynthesis protein HemY [Bradyrhizobiaceae bacterium]
MIRVAIFFALLAVIALGAAWFADRPGEVVLTWQGWRISTSLMVAGVALLAVIAAAIFVWSLLRFVLRTPQRVGDFMHERKQLRGWRAVSRGLIAVGSGNAALARRSAGEAQKLLGGEPLTLLLAAQAAQLSGDATGAETNFRDMLAHDETKLLGLHGLFIEARRRADPVAALGYAEEAARADPGLGWAGDAVIEFRCRAGDWAGALEALDRQIAAKAVAKPAGKRRRAVLLTAQAMALEETDGERAREAAAAAVKLAPDLVPAVALSARLEAAAGSVRRASRMLERAFAAHPHPELAETYMDLRASDTARDRLERMQSLAMKTPGNPEALIAVARAAIDAQDFGKARDVLSPLVAEPTQRVCLLMAEIESVEHGDHGKAREWTARAVRARRDPAWVADGYVSERWLPISPLSGKLDAFVWTVPPESMAGPVLEQVAQQAIAAASAKAPPSAPPARLETIVEPPPEPTKAEVIEQRRAPRRKPAVEPVVAEPPLPDDPGPEPEADAASEGPRFRIF